MNSNVEGYLARVFDANTAGLEANRMALIESLPCIVARELQVVHSDFIESSEPLMVSYRSLPRLQHVLTPAIPRKIEFDSAVYLKEGIIDNLFPNAKTTLLFVGDGNSDKRFSYNCHRLFETFPGRYKIRCFICNTDDAFWSKPFLDGPPQLGWDADDPDRALFFHATDWEQLEEFTGLAQSERADNRQVLALIDLDATYLCPRPSHHSVIKAARRDAIVAYSKELFDGPLDPDETDDDGVARLTTAYTDASATAFSRAYDDEDLTMLLALGLYARIIDKDDPLVASPNQVRFTVPVEWLRYASFVINNDDDREVKFRRLRALYVKAADLIHAGSPTAFPEFRRREASELARRTDVTLNRSVTRFIRDCAGFGVVPIAFSDRPNASLGLVSGGPPAFTAKALTDAPVLKPLPLTD